MLKIGDFSKLSRVSIRMLRHYDEIGLLKPVWIDPESGYRYYSAEQLPVAGRINALKDMGFGLAAIGEILPCYEDRDALERHLRCKQAELQALSDQTAYRLRLLETAQLRLRKEDKIMNYDVTIKTFPARYSATVRMVIPSYEEEGKLWDLLMKESAPFSACLQVRHVWCLFPAVLQSVLCPMQITVWRAMERPAASVGSVSVLTTEVL